MTALFHGKTHQELIRILGDFIDLTGLEELNNPDTCPEGMLPALALYKGASTYSNGLLGAEYDRQAIRDAKRINRLTGTQAALTIFAENVGITYSIQETRGGTPARVISIVVCVNETTRNGVNFIKFLTETFLLLLPVTIAVTRVDVCPSISSPVEVASGFRGYEWNVDTVGVL